MTAQELRKKYLDFFKSKGHTIIPSASLVPAETDASVLFTTAGMHPLVPFLLGEPHPGGKRVVNVQKCVRTGDIDDVGDNRHLTFFEMMGNWSFGDYFKKEAIEWSFEFLTGKEWLNLDPKRIYVTVFKGYPSTNSEQGIPRDEEAIKIWQETFSNSKIGINAEIADDDGIIKNNIRIIPLGLDDNFWIAGATGPCGGDTEMFYDTRPSKGKIDGQKFSDLVDSFRLIEVWNDVFMEFEKKAGGSVEKLAQQNVDTGMGVERTLAILNDKESVFDTELFQPIFEKISEISDKKYEGNENSFRIIADHIKSATFMISDGVEPSNVMRGYVLRRLIRRAIRYGKVLGIDNNFTQQISETVIEMYKTPYSELEKNKDKILESLGKEEDKFRETLEKGLKILEKEIRQLSWSGEKAHDVNGISILDSIPIWRMKKSKEKFPGKIVFDLYQTYGFPLEITKEELQKQNIEIDEKGFQEEFQKHQELSRTASGGVFKGGLQSQDKQTTKLHTATHLLQAALREVLGPHVFQKGSNITAERLRFDFSHHEKMTPEQIEKIENLVNEKIRESIFVICKETDVETAKKEGAIGVFESKYSEKVKVYSVGEFSKEICGGPHVQNTSELGHFKILKEEAVSAGVRRIKAILE